MQEVETVKIQAEHESQGEFVIINKDDFDPKVHKEYGAAAKPKTAPKKAAPKAKAPKK